MSPAAPGLSMGSRLAGRYELRERLGDGAMGTVYGAFDLELEREVAVKSMLPSLVADPDFVLRFQREARALARLHHPNIIGLYDMVRPPEGGLYLILELVRGHSLDDEIRTGAPLPWARCAGVGIDVCRALETAHAAGVVHRDIKPSNILIGRDGAAHVADFGIAHLAGGADTTNVGVMIGTPEYFSPEQAEARPATAQADVYSLCVVLFEAVTGSLPFDSGGGLLRIAMQHLNSPVPDPRDLRPDLAPEVAELIMRGMQKSPSDRFPGAGALAGALMASLGAPGVSAPARRPTPPPPPAPTLRGREDTAPAAAPRTAGARDPRPAKAPSPPRPAPRRPRPASPVPPTVSTAGRDAVASEEPRAPVRSRRRGAWVAAAAAAALAGVAGGLALGGAGGDAAPSPTGTTVTAGGVTTRLPPGWGPSAAGTPPLGLTDAASFSPVEAPGGGSVTLGRATATGPALLPAPLVSRLTTPAGDGERVEVGGIEALRRTGLRASGIDGALTVYAVPAAAGVVTVACIAPPSSSADVGGACESAVTSLDLGDDRVYALDPDPVYARAVAAPLRRLARARDAGVRALRAARTPAGQAAAARGLASAHATAADGLDDIDPGPGRASVHDDLTGAARRGRAAFAAMAAAAQRDDRAAFAAARRSATAADGALRSALGRLEGLGYDLR